MQINRANTHKWKGERTLIAQARTWWKFGRIVIYQRGAGDTAAQQPSRLSKPVDANQSEPN